MIYLWSTMQIRFTSFQFHNAASVISSNSTVSTDIQNFLHRASLYKYLFQFLSRLHKPYFFTKHRTNIQNPHQEYMEHYL